MRVILRLLVVAAFLVALVAPPAQAIVQAGVGLDIHLCTHVDVRADIPDSFALNACFDGSTLHIANRSSVPVVIGYSGERGPVTKYTLDRVPSPAARVLSDAYSFDPGVLLPGYALAVEAGDGALEVAVLADYEIAKRYAYLDLLARSVPIASLGSAAVELVNELADAWDNDQDCRRGAGWAGEIKCEALYLRNVGFALARAGVDGLLGFVVSAISEVQSADRWVSDVDRLVTGGVVALSPEGALQLSGDGVDIVDFGSPAEVGLETLRSRLGEPDADSDWQRFYSSDEMDPETRSVTVPGVYYASADDVLGDAWQHRYHRRICWQSLCVHFGGAEQSSASITGWELAKWLPVADYTADPKLPDAELEDTGIRLGSTWVELQAAYPDVVAGGAEGNTLAVDDTPWGGIFDGVATWRLSGQWNYERPTDAPADATVTRLSAGDGPEPGCC